MIGKKREKAFLDLERRTNFRRSWLVDHSRINLLPLPMVLGKAMAVSLLRVAAQSSLIIGLRSTIPFLTKVKKPSSYLRVAPLLTLSRETSAETTRNL